MLSRRADIDTADVPAEIARAAVPPLQPNREGKYQAGLYAAWKLAGTLATGAARAFFEGHEQLLLDHVKARNDSILAHGFEPITRETWTRMSTWFEAAVVPVLVAELALAGEREPFPQPPDIYDLWN